MPFGTNKGEVLYRRSRLYSSSKAWNREKEDLEEIVSMKDTAGLSNDRMAQVFTALAAVSAQKEDYASVVKYSELAVKAGSSDPGIYMSVAGSYIEAKDYAKAVQLLETAPIPAEEKKHQYYTALAAAYAGMENYGKAYTTLKTGLTVKAPRPVLAATAKQMGLVCFELKRYKEAKMYLGYTLRAGGDCPECGLLLTTIDSLAP
jgi:tetratricopeptide (TPR) repeat protein